MILSACAEKWEREHGGIRVQRRVDRRQAREKNEFPLPAMEPKRGRDGAGRPVKRSREGKREWRLPTITAVAAPTAALGNRGPDRRRGRRREALDEALKTEKDRKR